MHNRSSIQEGEPKISASVITQIKQVALQEDTKNAAAVVLGHLGGLKGGKARAKKLSAKRRSKIAYKAATMRWSIK